MPRATLQRCGQTCPGSTFHLCTICDRQTSAIRQLLRYTSLTTFAERRHAARSGVGRLHNFARRGLRRKDAASVAGRNASATHLGKKKCRCVAVALRLHFESALQLRCRCVRQQRNAPATHQKVQVAPAPAPPTAPEPRHESHPCPHIVRRRGTSPSWPRPLSVSY